MSQDEEREFFTQRQELRKQAARIKQLENTVSYLQYALNNSHELSYETNSTNIFALKILKETIEMLNNKTNTDPMGLYVKSYHLLNRN